MRAEEALTWDLSYVRALDALVERACAVAGASGLRFWWRGRHPAFAHVPLPVQSAYACVFFVRHEQPVGFSLGPLDEEVEVSFRSGASLAVEHVYGRTPASVADQLAPTVGRLLAPSAADRANGPPIDEAILVPAFVMPVASHYDATVLSHGEASIEMGDPTDGWKVEIRCFGGAVPGFEPVPKELWSAYIARRAVPHE